MVYAQPFLGYHDNVQQPQVEQSRQLDFQVWWPQFSKVLYILSRTVFKPQETAYLPLFIKSFIQVVPNAQYRQYMYEFYIMQPNVVRELLRLTPNIFLAYPSLQQELVADPLGFRIKCFRNEDNLLFIWVYLLDAFLVSKTRSTFVPSLNDQRERYKESEITKKDWGNSMWFLLHLSSMYCLQESLQDWVNMLLCLQWLLPCPLCRTHLTKNLGYLNLQSARNSQDLFVASWTLHNLVNQITHANPISLQQAAALYTF